MNRLLQPVKNVQGRFRFNWK